MQKIKINYNLDNQILNFDISELLGDTVKEKYESLYVKFIKISTGYLNEGANSVQLIMPPYLTDGFMRNRVNQIGRVFIGNLNMRWKVYQDSELDPDSIQIESNIGTTTLVFNGLYKFVDSILKF